MTKLIETDEEVEKAGKREFRGAKMSAAARRKIATGDGAKRPPLAYHVERWKWKNGVGAGRKALLRSGGVGANRPVRKSTDPTALEALDAAIEKAKPLLARGKDGSRSGVVGGRTIRLERAQGTYGLGTKKSPLKPMTYRLSVENGSTRHGYNMAHKDSRARGKDHLSRLKRGKPGRGE